jgi:hypothetical protein
MQSVDPSVLETVIEQIKPTRKMSVVRGLMPKINEAIRRGLSKKEIWESLHDAGLEMSYKMFVTYLSRIDFPRGAHGSAPPARNASFPDALQGPDSTQLALERARKNVAAKDYSKLMRNRKTGHEK